MIEHFVHPTSPLSNIPQKRPKLSFFQVIHISFVGVSFSLVVHLPISRIMVSILDPVEQVIDEIKQIKRNDEHLELLAEMNELMIDEYWVELKTKLSNQNKGKKRHSGWTKPGSMYNDGFQWFL